MTLLEMLIQFKIEYDSIRSNIFKDFLKQEIVNLLNKAMFQRIDFSCLNKDYESIQELITEKELKCYLENENKTFSLLPANYYKDINSNSAIKTNCTEKSKLYKNENLYYCIVGLNNTSNSFVDYAINYEDSIKDYEFLLANYYPTGITNQRKYEIIDIIQNYFNKETTVQCYWENFYTFNIQNSFIFTSVNDFSINLTTDGVQSNLESSLLSFTKIDDTANAVVSDRKRNEYEINDLSKNSLGKTSKNSVLTTIKGNRIVSYEDATFSVVSKVLTFVRKPKMLNYEVNIGCELSVILQREIVSMAAKEAKMISEQTKNNKI